MPGRSTSLMAPGIQWQLWLRQRTPMILTHRCLKFQWGKLLSCCLAVGPETLIPTLVCRTWSRIMVTGAGRLFGILMMKFTLSLLWNGPNLFDMPSWKADLGSQAVISQTKSLQMLEQGRGSKLKRSRLRVARSRRIKDSHCQSLSLSLCNLSMTLTSLTLNWGAFLNWHVNNLMAQGIYFFLGHKLGEGQLELTTSCNCTKLRSRGRPNHMTTCVKLFSYYSAIQHLCDILILQHCQLILSFGSIQSRVFGFIIAKPWRGPG